MTERRPLVFVCAHLCDERLYAPQLAALSPAYDCSVHCFREHDSLGGMAEELLAAAPPRFTLIGLSLGGYVALEVIRRQFDRLEQLVMMDTSAVADDELHRAGRFADIAKVKAGGIDALIPELPARWLHPAHATRPDLVGLMASMARAVGAQGQYNQQQAMLARPDSHADLRRVRIPTRAIRGIYAALRGRRLSSFVDRLLCRSSGPASSRLPTIRRAARATAQGSSRGALTALERPAIPGAINRWRHLTLLLM